ncbi:hypothetical protein NX059_001041 [Plenodomus lindquistii]|nr:hypothetical protein NX059_001041 [Plenodomus lindquistii]
MSAQKDDIIVSPVETEQDLIDANHCVSEAFGTQTRDAIWMVLNPGWDTTQGRLKNAHGLIQQWKSTTTNKDGQPNAIYLKATVPDSSKSGAHVVAGMAIWQQL